MGVSNRSFTDMYGEETIEVIDGLFEYNALDDIVMLAEAPTGTGKSHFVKNRLYYYCKEHGYKMLYLVPRKAVKNEFVIELKGNSQEDNRTDIITVATYQSLEDIDKQPDFEPYNIIICDECHYFTSDSLFNPDTFISYNRILSAKNKLRFFMTATPHPFRGKLKWDIAQRSANNPNIKPGVLECRMPQEVSPIKDVRFIPTGTLKSKRDYIESILNNLVSAKNEKVIVFCNSKEYARELQNKYEDSMFICSEYDERYSKHIDQNAYSKLLREHKFPCKFLFCTSALDVGFNIKDKEVRHIVCMFDDWNSIVQAIGRKRMLNDSDRITIYLPDRSNRRIGQMWNNIDEILEHYNYFNNNGAAAYLRKYSKRVDPYKIICYVDAGNGLSRPEVDYFVFNYYCGIMDNLSEIRQINSLCQYKDWVLKKFGLSSSIEESAEYIRNALKPFIDSGRVFTKNDLHEVSDIICHKDKGHGRVFKSANKLNDYLQSIDVNIKIVSSQERGVVDGKDKKTTVYHLEYIE